MAVFTQVGADTSYAVLLFGGLFVMGLGMGATMMPIMTAALQTLKQHQVARGSTLMNILQQVASSIGTATMSVILTNGLKSHELANPAILMQTQPEQAKQLGIDLSPSLFHLGLSQGADAFGFTFTVALILLAVCFVPAFLLPRHKATAEAGQAPAPALAH